MRYGITVLVLLAVLLSHQASAQSSTIASYWQSGQPYADYQKCLSNSVLTGVECYYKIWDAYTLDGTIPVTPNPVSGTGYKIRRMTAKSTAGAYDLVLRPNLGDPEINRRTVNVYYPVGTVTVTPPSTMICHSNGSTSQFTANAVNATNYTDWTISSGAGTVDNYGLVTWTEGYNGSPTISVRASNPAYNADEYPSGSTLVTSLQNVAFSAYMGANPNTICEGESVGLAALSIPANAGQSYEWFLDDDGDPRYFTQQINTSVGELYSNSNMKVKVTPKSNLQCVTSLTPKFADSNQIQGFTIIPRVSVSPVNAPISEMCQASVATTQFTASSSNSTSIAWSIWPYNPGAPTPTNHAGVISQTGLVTWNPNFQGPAATITYTGNGCGGSIDQQNKTIIVKKIPTIFPLSAPSDLCPLGTGTISLLGSEANVNYQLHKDIGWGWYPQGTPSTTTSWQLPISNGSIGNFKVVATPTNGCNSTETPTIVINPIAKGPITIIADNGAITPDGKIFICEGTNVTFTASGGTDYTWRAELSKSPGCPPLNPNLNEKYCYPAYDLYGGPPNQISFTAWSFANWYPIYVTALDNVCGELTKSSEILIVPTPALHLREMTPTVDFRCAGQQTDLFEMDFLGILVDFTWSLSEGGSLTTPPGSDDAVVTWDPNYTGLTELKFTGLGCDGPESLSQWITVYPQLETSENYVRTLSAQQPLAQPLDLFTSLSNTQKVNAVTNYFDGLGRNVQNVNINAAPSGQDIVELKRYDNYGRENIKHLPYVSSHDLNYKNTAVQDQLNFYMSGSNTIAGDTKPLSITQYEPSPLNRTLKQGAPGTVWQPNNDPYDVNDHSVKILYGFNKSNDVILFSYDSNTGLISADVAGQIRYYSQGELTANSTLDENNNAIVEYLDKQGRTVCKKVQHDGDLANPLYASTYYIYDDLGNLVTVIPPEGVKSALNQFTQN